MASLVNMDDQARKQIQRLMSDPNWAGMEQFFKHYTRSQFIQNSVKKETEFDTIWYLAHIEGGKHHLYQFMNQLEEEAKQV